MTHAELLAAGFEVSESAHEAMGCFLERLLERNRQVNLTAVRDLSDAWRVHICDSLALLGVLPDDPGTLLDLGSGGGVPGIPLAIARPDLTVALLDGTRKKVDAAAAIAAELGLRNVSAIWGRAETRAHDPEFREQFDVVTARAVGSVRTLLELTSGFVRVRGAVWLFKTLECTAIEVAHGCAAATACKLGFIGRQRYRLPGEEADRVLVGYRKWEPLPADLPRAVGLPAKRPL